MQTFLYYIQSLLAWIVRNVVALINLHFALISDAKIITSRLPPYVLKLGNIGFASVLDEEEMGLNSVVYKKRAIAYKTQGASISNTVLYTYVIFWQLRFSVSLLTCDIPIFTG